MRFKLAMRAYRTHPMLSDREFWQSRAASTAPPETSVMLLTAMIRFIWASLSLRQELLRVMRMTIDKELRE